MISWTLFVLTMILMVVLSTARSSMRRRLVPVALRIHEDRGAFRRSRRY